MIKYKVNSSNIELIGYDLKTKELIIGFKGGSEYSYKNIDKNDVCDLMFADSVGKEFYRNIKKKEAEKLK